jgi:single-stranded-DNA-specific exonuclease
MRWELRTCDADAAAQLARSAELHPVVARLLVQRGITTSEAAADFLAPTLSQLHSPYLMMGMDRAIERIQAAIARSEKILIYGDYDVDGTTAVVILKTAIEICGGAAGFHVPHRIREGYGIRNEVLERAAADGYRLIISVDTGIRAFAAADTAQRLGLDLIVTDHHLPEDGGVPNALAVLNPNQPGCGYPCKSLCGAGVAFKIAQALLQKAGRERLVPSFLKMAAIATIADAVPLVGENRVIARLGLRGLSDPRNLGLRALMEVAGIDLSRRLSAMDVAFKLAPRLNAAGRMNVAEDVVELFTVRDPGRARALADRLNQLNTDRQQEEARIMNDITTRLDADPATRESFCLVIDGDGWHRGVIGIAATRVVERYCRPALVCSRDEAGEAHGSGRSIAAFHLLSALESCRHLFNRFGGHAHAVGFALPAERLPELRASLDTFARARLTPADFEPALAVDAELPIDQVTMELHRALADLEPFGMDNPEPVFCDRRARLVAPARVLKEKHLKLRLAPSSFNGSGRSLDAVAWRMAEKFRVDENHVRPDVSSVNAHVGPDVSSGNAHVGPDVSSGHAHVGPDVSSGHRAEGAPVDSNRVEPRDSPGQATRSVAAGGSTGLQPGEPQPQNIPGFSPGAQAGNSSGCSLTAGDSLDVAFRVDYNSHPDFGGALQMVLLDILRSVAVKAS